MNTYITKSGDAWDMIAKRVYGDESYVSFLMKNNQKLLEYFLFPSGVEISIPELPEEFDEDDFPDWRKE